MQKLTARQGGAEPWEHDVDIEMTPKTSRGQRGLRPAARQGPAWAETAPPIKNGGLTFESNLAGTCSPHENLR